MGPKGVSKCLRLNPSPDPSSLSSNDDREVNNYSFDNATSNDIALSSTKLHDDVSISLLVNNEGTMWQYNDMKNEEGDSMVIGGKTHMEAAFYAPAHIGNTSSIITHNDMCSKSSVEESSQTATSSSIIKDGDRCGHMDVNNIFQIETASSMITDDDMGLTFGVNKQSYMGVLSSTLRDNERYTKMVHFNEGDTFGGVAPPQKSIIEHTMGPHDGINVRDNTGPHDGMICDENMAHGVDHSADLEAVSLVENDSRALTENELQMTEKQTALTSAVDERFPAVVAKLQQQQHEQAQGLARTNDRMERHLNEMRDSFIASLAQQHAHISHLQEK